MKLKLEQWIMVLFNIVACIIAYVVSIRGFILLGAADYDWTNVAACVLFITFASLELANVPLMICCYSYKNKHCRKDIEFLFDFFIFLLYNKYIKMSAANAALSKIKKLN